MGEVNAGVGIPPRNIHIEGNLSCPPPPPQTTVMNGGNVYPQFGGSITDMLVM